jgi:hypothetical protein
MNSGRSNPVFRIRILVLAVSILLPISIQSAFADQIAFSRLSSITTGQYSAASISDNGLVIVASARFQGIYRSGDGGATWTNYYYGGTYRFAMSADGTKILAIHTESGSTYTSTDSGVSWTERPLGVTTVGRPCISDDGQYMQVNIWTGIPKISNDGGSTWSDAPGLASTTWRSCAMSSSGAKRYLTNNGTTLFRSSDYGASWQSTTLPYSGWMDVGTSSDGSIVFIVSSTRIYKSTDSGASFSLVNNGTTFSSATGIGVSGDGNNVVVFDSNSIVKSSKDGGSSWILESSLGTKNWQYGDMSTNGMRIAAPDGTNGSYVWKGLFISPTTLTLNTTGLSTLDFGRTTSLTASSNYDGRITFFANGKRIRGCVSLLTSSLSATCFYKPSIHGAVTISATITPTNSSYATLNAELVRVKISPRATLR